MAKPLALTSVLAIALYGVMLAWSLPHLTMLAQDQAVFDMRPTGYDAETARAFLSALGEGGRDFYLNVQQWLDLVFPPMKALALVLAFRVLAPRGWAWGLGAVALAAAVFDLLENAAVAALLRAGPEGIDAAMVSAASRWTILKSVSDTIALGALVVLMAQALWRRLRR